MAYLKLREEQPRYFRLNAASEIFQSLFACSLRFKGKVENYIPIFAKLSRHRASDWNKFQQQSPVFTGEIINIFVVVVEKFNDETLKLGRVNYD